MRAIRIDLVGWPIVGHVPDVESALGHLRARGERITTARRVVLDQLASAEGHHLTVEEIAAAVQVDHPDIHLSTIYRTLDFLTAAGVVVDVHFGSGPVTYHFAADAHHHAVCERCGLVIELAPEAFAGVTRQLARDHGFHAVPKHVVIGGVCATCQPAG
jgi:Fur family ferric uptake transcriptional regulator